MSEYQAAECFVAWLEEQIVASGRGDDETTLEVEPSGKYWLGRLAPEEYVANMGLGDRGERLEPCAVGVLVRPEGDGHWDFSIRVRMVAWLRGNDRHWRKTKCMDKTFTLTVPPTQPTQAFGRAELEAALAAVTGIPGLSAEIRVDLRPCVAGGREMAILLVNTSPEQHSSFRDTRLYECILEVVALPTRPFLLEALPDSFRYDRRVPAYGINCGVEVGPDGAFRTLDVIVARRPRPRFWGSDEPEPNLRFSELACDPLPASRTLTDGLRRWGSNVWSDAALVTRAAAQNWSAEMLDEARSEAARFAEEVARIETGMRLLETNDRLSTAFRLMNQAMTIASKGRGYDGWRPFQFGFLLANLPSVIEPGAESDIVDIVWFATGGGKTETYLGLLMTSALFDRLRGKSTGVTGWSRFPLRMLSLQQMQRFADAMAAAELVRRDARIGGDPFSVGFLVGQGATPNAIRPDPPEGDPWDPDDEHMPERLRVLQHCPFCRGEQIAMTFDRRLWKLEHRRETDNCPWPERALPFYVVDHEIYRFLPTVVVGTLDKAASISMQAAMRGLVGAPLGCASELVTVLFTLHAAPIPMVASCRDARRGFWTCRWTPVSLVPPFGFRMSCTCFATPSAPSMRITKPCSTVSSASCVASLPRSWPPPPRSRVTRSRPMSFTEDRRASSRNRAQASARDFGTVTPVR
jgi:hypothetical protein